MPSSKPGTFQPGDPRINRSGGPKKPDWLKGKGVEALQKAYEIMTDPKQRPDIVLTAARMLAEYDLGKPAQGVALVAELGEETRNAISGLTLGEKVKLLERMRREAFELPTIDAEAVQVDAAFSSDSCKPGTEQRLTTPAEEG